MPDLTRTACPRCETSYAPAVVGGRCPVCGVPAPGHAARRRVPADNALLLVGAATIANVLLLSVLVVLLLR